MFTFFTLVYLETCNLNVKILITILCTLPVTTCSAERSFSVLKRTKSPLQSTMTTERLTELSLLSIHRDIKIDINAAINEFGRDGPRLLTV